MGVEINVPGADYSLNNVEVVVPTPLENLDFSLKSTNANNVVYYPLGGIVTIKNGVSTGNFEFALTPSVISAKVKVPMDNAVPVHVICIGTDVNGNAIVVYLDNTGLVRKFDKNGTSGSIVLLYTIPSSRPNTPKGTEVTITHTSTYVTISYAGYTMNLLYSNIPTLTTKAVGFLTTSPQLNSYFITKLT